MPLRSNSTVIVVVVAVGVVVAVAVGGVPAGVVKVLGLIVGKEAVVAVAVTVREVEIVTGAVMYLSQVEHYGLLQICRMPF